MNLRTVIQAAALGLAAATAAFALMGSASAHVDIASSSPAAGSTIASSPAAVTITFDGAIQKAPGSYGLAVTNEQGSSVTAGQPAVSADGTQVSVTLRPSLANGAYTVEWSNTSADDGDSESGSFTFYVGGAGGDMPAAPDGDGSHSDGHGHGDDDGHEAGFDPPTTGLIVARLSELNGSGVSGRAEILPVDGGARTAVYVFLNGVKPNSSHMTHIHVNTNCAPEPGPHAADLNNTIAGNTTTGRSENIVDVPFSVVANGKHSIFAHVGADPSGDKTPIVCGGIPAQPEGEHGHDGNDVSLPAAGTGTGVQDDVNGLILVAAILALTGAGFASGSVVIRRRKPVIVDR